VVRRSARIGSFSEEPCRSEQIERGLRLGRVAVGEDRDLVDRAWPREAPDQLPDRERQGTGQDICDIPIGDVDDRGGHFRIMR
jgi:hypothetical protein